MVGGGGWGGGGGGGGGEWVDFRSYADWLARR